MDGTLIEVWASWKSFRPKGESRGIGRRLTTLAIRRWTSEARNAATPRTNRRRIQNRGWLGRGEGIEAVVLAARADGESKWVGGRHLHRRGYGKGRSDERAADALRASGSSWPSHDRWRQGLRHQRIRALDPSDERHPARCQKRVSSAIVGAGRSNDEARRVRGEPTDPQTGRRDLWMDEDRRELQAHTVQGQAPTSVASFFVGAAYNLLRMGRLLAKSA